MNIPPRLIKLLKETIYGTAAKGCAEDRLTLLAIDEGYTRDECSTALRKLSKEKLIEKKFCPHSCRDRFYEPSLASDDD